MHQMAEYWNRITVAKNYLEETEIGQLERTVTSYFDYIEGLAERRNTLPCKSLAESIDRFLSSINMEIQKEKDHF